MEMQTQTFRYDDVAIAPDRQIGMHSHPQWELSHVIVGRGWRIIGDKTAQMEEGEIVLIPPEIPHVWEFDPDHTDADGNIKNISVFFERTTLDGIAAVMPEFKSVVDRLKLREVAVSYTGESYLRILNLLMEMRNLSQIERLPKFLELLQVLADMSEGIASGRHDMLSPTARRLEKVRIYCSCNYSRPITLDEMAKYAGMNKSAFCTFMRRHAGMTLSEFVNDIRLQRGMELLRHTGRSITSVAYDVGFSSQIYFTRLFKRKFNCTPKSIRMNAVDSSICRYVEDHVIPRYADFDKAHQADHVNMVIQQSLQLCNHDKSIDRNMAYVVAAFHDLGLANGRENHHIDSRKILEADEFLKKHFSPEQIRMMGEAVEDHRASRSTRPRNIYGLIVAEADRFIESETILRRALQYGLNNYPELDREGQYRRAQEHLIRKYGPDGYLKVWLPWSDNAARLEQLRRILTDPSSLRPLFDRLYDEETR